MAERKLNLRKLTTIAMLSALSTVLMFFSFSVPFMPSFIKLDFSEFPALIAAFTLGPVSGVAVCLVKNLVNVMFSTTGGIGELSNFILGAMFVFPAGLIYAKFKTRKGALVGSLTGALVMAVLSVPINFFVVYPIYANFMPIEAIMGAYKAINPNINNLWEALAIFNMPFTFIKGLCSVILTFLVYKKISPIIKGKRA